MVDVVVAGGGAAGMLCSYFLAEGGCNVTLVDKNEELGKKLRITGKGRCNITNAAEDVETLIANVTTNGAFLYSAFYSFSNHDVIRFFNNLGVATKVERGERVFPVSDRAADVVYALRNALAQKGVRVRCGVVEKVLTEKGEAKGIELSGGERFFSDKVVLCMGGASYPVTGSDGSGFRIARNAGHTITPLRASLVPLVCSEKFCYELSGLSLKNAGIKVMAEGVKKPVYEDFGELLFTHFGVSGPVILSASAHIKDCNIKKYKLLIDLKPALSTEQLDMRVRRDFSEMLNKNFSNSLDKLLPKKLIDVIVQLSDIPPHKKVNEITREERYRLVSLLKGLKLNITGARPLAEAVVTSGGVDVKEIKPSTMESRYVKGLYFTGEMIDVDAYTGGFNLQIAWSTAYLAAKGILIECARNIV